MEHRCGWAGPEQIYIDYNDTEWGVPEYDSRALWEKLILDGFQAGLSWITILKKRNNFRAAFAGFDPNVIANWGEDEIATLLQNAGIIRHRGKIAATITNAQAWQRIEAAQGFTNFYGIMSTDTLCRPRWMTGPPCPLNPRCHCKYQRTLRKLGLNFAAQQSFMRSWRLVV